MSNVIINLLPLIFAAALPPGWIIRILALLRDEGGRIKAAAFVLGAVTVRVLQFILLSHLFDTVVSAEGEHVFDLVPTTLFLLAGITLLATAAKAWAWRRNDDANASSPKGLTIGGASALRAFGVAVVMMAVSIKQWIFTLCAIAIIEEGKLGQSNSMLAYLFFILGAQSLTLVALIAPAAGTAERLLGWLERNERIITTVVSVVFGIWFVARGMSGLAAHGSALRMPGH
jgi:hypothetical protein